MNIEKQFKIKAEKGKVIKVFSDLEEYGRLHPLILSVQNTNIQEKGYTEYKIKEQPYSWIPIRINYKAKVHSIEGGIEYFISGIPFSKATMKYQFIQISKTETEIVFNLNIEGILMVKNILANKMIGAQNMLIKSIKKEFNS